MPELPEVEIIRRALEVKVLNQMIGAVRVFNPHLRYPVDRQSLEQFTHHQVIQRVDRRGKYLLLHLANSYALIIHLGMSGRILIVNPETPLAKHDHILFDLAGGTQMRFRDPRRFGLVDVISLHQLVTHPYFSALGVEPLSSAIRGDSFFFQNRKVKRPIKTFLMDASQIVGVGNIYANEALFVAGIRPTRQTRRLTLTDWRKLIKAIRKVLTQAIENGGTTFSDFRNSDGEQGRFQYHLFVYQRDGQPCRRCKSPIRRTCLSGRSTFYCSVCQQS